MTDTPDIKRPPAELVAGIKAVGAATASATLAHMGIRNAHMTGPVSWNKGKAIAGPALTLQFMPKREDLYGGGLGDDLFPTQPRLDGVTFAVPDTPGLGIEVNETLLGTEPFRFWEAPHLRRRDGSVTNW